MGQAIRRSFDQVYDGQHTGRFHLAQLSKTEKTNTGSLVEIWLARMLKLSDGRALDFCIAGHDVDCKFSYKDGGWMLPPEVIGEIAMLLTADDYAGTWSLGLVRVTRERTRASTNRDAKTSLSAGGRQDIDWIFRNESLPDNVLLRIPAAETIAIMRGQANGRATSGQQRLDELFRRCTDLRISRTVIATVAQQDDFMKRVRSNGGSRSRLAGDGYLLLGHYARHQQVAAALGVPVPLAGEIVSIRVAQCQPEDRSARSVEIDGGQWRLWSSGDVVAAAPDLAHR
ncbi:MAG: restriction endonuclease [Actinobacteria bacterium]|nr:restriction endonuclease [Actinomycetota bacterium]